MTGLVESPLAGVQSAARQCIGRVAAWPDLGIGLAYRVFRRADMQLPAAMDKALPEETEVGFRRAPRLAAFGFVLDQVSEGTRRGWVSGVEFLRGREPFPGDRNSFVYSPCEVLGIAQGLTIVGDDPHDQRDWFANLMIRGLKTGQFSTPLTQLAGAVALQHVDPGKARTIQKPELDIDALSMNELALATAITCAFGNEATLPIARLEAAFSARILSEPISVNDAGEAAALLVLCQHLIDQLALGTQPASAEETIMALCRRFPLFAAQLSLRYDQRATFEIKDEYDVQDLFHAILLLHFDDVRPEEVTPSYAGNSSRVDFYLPDAHLIVEVKMTRQNLQQKDIVKQLTEDAARYAAMDKISTLICLVYDPQRYCKSPVALEKDVQESGRKLSVKVIVCPKGI